MERAATCAVRLNLRCWKWAFILTALLAPGVVADGDSIKHLSGTIEPQSKALSTMTQHAQDHAGDLASRGIDRGLASGSLPGEKGHRCQLQADALRGAAAGEF